MSDGEQPAMMTNAAPATVGGRLRAAREAQGLAIAEVAARTRVTQRFLEALEQDRLDLLPSPTYASGFARAYARAVGLDQAEIGRDIRGELARGAMPLRQHHIEEIADPSRGPSRGLVIVGAGVALAVLVLGVLWLSTGLFRGTQETPESVAGTASVAASATVPPPAVRAPAAAGKVVLTARGDVWLRVYDGTDKTLFTGTLAPGQTFEVPAGTDRPMLNIGRPDQLAVVVDGREVAPLGDGKRALKDVPITAAALAARGLPAPAPSPIVAPSPAASGSPATVDDSAPSAFRTAPAGTPTP